MCIYKAKIPSLLSVLILTVVLAQIVRPPFPFVDPRFSTRSCSQLSAIHPQCGCFTFFSVVRKPGGGEGTKLVRLDPLPYEAGQTFHVDGQGLREFGRGEGEKHAQNYNVFWANEKTARCP